MIKDVQASLQRQGLIQIFDKPIDVGVIDYGTSAHLTTDNNNDRDECEETRSA